ncbi:MAG: hypothetical protein KF689_02540 [Gemmatimonadaceae bacterium]|nr:hypothetical protein [Gemmatimonadaceae bacterium]MCW5826815.1 hypothetical protein [Gemmatimonadaceae bacterium]
MPYRLAILLVVAAAPLHAQAPDSAALTRRSQEALAPIQRIVGQWIGDARAWEGPGEPISVRQHEDIVFGARGSIIQIRGTGRDPRSDAIVFEAAATIWFDPQAGKVRMRTHRDGNSLEPDIELKPDTVIWGFPVAGGRVRYVIALTDSTWHEVGYYERAGAPPQRTLEMHLRRSGPPR